MEIIIKPSLCSWNILGTQ